MSTANKILFLNNEQLVFYLKENNYENIARIVNDRNLDAKTFLNLSELDIKKFQLPKPNANEILVCIEQLKKIGLNSPAVKTKPTLPSKLNRNITHKRKDNATVLSDTEEKMQNVKENCSVEKVNLPKNKVLPKPPPFRQIDLSSYLNDTQNIPIQLKSKIEPSNLTSVVIGENKCKLNDVKNDATANYSHSSSYKDSRKSEEINSYREHIQYIETIGSKNMDQNNSKSATFPRKNIDQKKVLEIVKPDLPKKSNNFIRNKMIDNKLLHMQLEKGCREENLKFPPHSEETNETSYLKMDLRCYNKYGNTSASEPLEVDSDDYLTPKIPVAMRKLPPLPVKNHLSYMKKPQPTVATNLSTDLNDYEVSPENTTFPEEDNSNIYSSPEIVTDEERDKTNFSKETDTALTCIVKKIFFRKKKCDKIKNEHMDTAISLLLKTPHEKSKMIRALPELPDDMIQKPSTNKNYSKSNFKKMNHLVEDSRTIPDSENYYGNLDEVVQSKPSEYVGKKCALGYKNFNEELEGMRENWQFAEPEQHYDNSDINLLMDSKNRNSILDESESVVEIAYENFYKETFDHLPEVTADSTNTDIEEEYANPFFNLNDVPSYRNTDRSGEAQLLKNCANGAFLFRSSKKYFLTLTVKNNSKYYRVGIEKTGTNKIRCSCLANEEGPTFNSINEFVDHFQREPLTLQEKNSLIYIRLNNDSKPEYY